MRKLNDKIYEIAGVDPSSGRTLMDKQEEVDVNQLLTETFFDESQAGIVEENIEQEAQEVLKSDYDKVYGEPKKKKLTTQSKVIKKATPSNANIQKPKTDKANIQKPKTKPESKVEKKEIENSNNNFQLIIFVVALGAIAFYYFFVK
mgnify:CR=1 FL=1